MRHYYHIEYDHPFEYEGDFLPLESEGDFMKVIETLAGDMDDIMDDIIHDLGIERYQLQFYYMVNHIILDRIIKLEQREMEATYK